MKAVAVSRPFSVGLESLRTSPEGVTHSLTRLRDMSWAFERVPLAGEDAPGSSAADRLVYESHEPTGLEDGALVFSVDVIHPGDSSGEYFMTKGHRHSRRDANEVYYGISGRGMMLCMSPVEQHGSADSMEPETVALPIEPGCVTYVPPGWAHRTVNVGDEDLVFLTVYPTGAGHDYEAVRRRGFGLRVNRGPDGPVVRRVERGTGSRDGAGGYPQGR